MKLTTVLNPITDDIVAFLKSHNQFMISGHIHADGDAYAAMIAMHLLAEALGKQSVMVLDDQKLDPRFDYLKHFNSIVSFKENMDLSPWLSGGKAQAAIILDVPGYKRLGGPEKWLPAAEHVLKIDHHPVEDEMGGIDWVDTKSSSTTAMVYDVYKKAGITIDLEMAKALYTGILYDTGRFSFSNTTAKDYAIASEMVAIGVQPAEITNRVFFESNFGALKTIGKGLASLEQFLEGAVHVIYLSNKDLTGQEQSEIEELANFSVAVKGGKVGLFIREIEPGFHKISLRSKSHVDVNQVAKAFNGGGHTRAAGCRISAPKNEVIQRLVAEIAKQL